jgi:hypothetical protein
MRHLALFGVALLLSLAACGGGPEEGEAAADAPKPEAPKVDCCKVTADLKAKMPDCCRKHAAGTAQACCEK